MMTVLPCHVFLAPNLIPFVFISLTATPLLCKEFLCSCDCLGLPGWPSVQTLRDIGFSEGNLIYFDGGYNSNRGSLNLLRWMIYIIDLLLISYISDCNLNQEYTR